MKKLYRFYVDAGRQGDLSGLFIQEETRVEECIGRRMYFGDVLGKHSDVQGDFEREDFKIVTDDQEFIAKFEELIGASFGHDPFAVFSDEEEGE